MADGGNASTVQVPSAVLREILQDGCCPLHLRTQLTRLLTGCSLLPHSTEETNGSGRLFDDLDAACASSITAFLPLPELLAARSVSSEFLHNAMRRPFEEDVLQLPSSGQNPQISEAPLPAERPHKNAVTCVHDRIRVRLWLQRMADITAGSADETVFESRVQSFVDVSMRNRVEAEMAAAKYGMAEEVRIAKQNMLQCVQAISEEVDRRVREKVTALQEQFDNRAAEQDQVLREMIEERVSRQTASMKEEVDRRTDGVREALESRAKVQEDVASKLQMEVESIREALEKRVYEQMVKELHLTAELKNLLEKFQEVVAAKEALEEKVAEQQQVIEQLAVVQESRLPAPASTCWAWLSCVK